MRKVVFVDGKLVVQPRGWQVKHVHDEGAPPNTAHVTLTVPSRMHFDSLDVLVYGEDGRFLGQFHWDCGGMPPDEYEYLRNHGKLVFTYTLKQERGW